MQITFKHRGDLSRTRKFLNSVKNVIKFHGIESYAEEGLAALRDATPHDTGNTARSWYYEIERSHGSVSVVYKNSNIQNGISIAIILQYGHGTGTGGYVEGRDYINPAVRPVFDKLAADMWEEVVNS